MEQLLLQRVVDYGAVELKLVYQKYVWRALAAAAALHFLFIGIYFSSLLVKQEETLRERVSVIIDNLGPPPSLIQSNTAINIGGSLAAKAFKLGIPVPVPNAEVSPDQVFPTQQEQSAVVDPLLEGKGDVRVELGNGNALVEETAPPPFVVVERQPEFVKLVQPKYPDMALRVGLEGTVWVSIWVDKLGKPRKALVVRSDAEILNQPSIDAAMQCVFTPAMMKNGPVSVWVSIPFRFKLSGK